MIRTLKRSLFALATLAIAALTAHMVDCGFAADHSARITRLDARSVETFIAKAEHTGSADGRGPAQIAHHSIVALVTQESPNSLQLVQRKSFALNSQDIAAGRNTSLAHRRSVVLVI